MRTFVYSDAHSHKFWSIELAGNSFTVAWGKVGTAGQKQVKTFPDEAKAKKEHDKLIAEKTGKGYLETTAAAAPPAGASLREALESAIINNPDDRASIAAYADWLSEQSNAADNALGEFMQLQMTLEDDSLPAAERKKLQKREKALIEKHQKEWAGDWVERASYTGPEGRGQLDMPEPRPIQFVRGLPAVARIGEMSLSCARAFVRSPQTRFINQLAVGDYALEDDDDVEDADEAAEATFARQWPHFGNLRAFQFGWVSDEEYDDFCHFQCHLGGRRIHEVVRKMSRLEELYLFAHGVDGHKIFALPMPRLRILQVYHSLAYPLEKLAKNASLPNLTHLLLHPHAIEGQMPLTLKGLKAIARSPHLKSLTHLRLRLTVFGDDGVREIIDSGLIERLKMLDLRHGRVSDSGAKLLAACAGVWKLERLDLQDNELTEEGIEALEATGVGLNVEHQHDADEGDEDDEDRQFLYQGDYE